MTLYINFCIEQRVTFRVRSVGVGVFLSFSIPHTLYHSFYISPLLPSLFLSLMGTGGEIPEGHRLAVAMVTDRHVCTGMKGAVGMGCVGVMVSCPHGLVRENVAQTEANRLSRLAREAGRKVSWACLYTSHPRIANFGCDPNCVRRKTEQSIIVLTKHSIKGKVL